MNTLPARAPAESPRPEYPGRTISDQEFALFQSLIYREAGIYLPQTKKPLLVRRLSGRLTALGLSSFAAYYRRVAHARDRRERIHMLDCVTTNETSFFREPKQFEFLEREVVPRWKRDADRGLRSKRVRAWSTACSSGEEPYSLAMLLLDTLPRTLGWGVDVLATDLSTRALSRAREATWSDSKLEEIPKRYHKRFLLKGKRSQVGRIRVGRQVREVVQLGRLNLHDSRARVDGAFDLILCRNVLIYFDAESKRGVIDRLVERLAPDGYLMVGHAESLIDASDKLRSVAPSVYRLTGGSVSQRA